MRARVVPGRTVRRLVQARDRRESLRITGVDEDEQKHVV